MLHAHLTTLHVVSLILEIFATQPELTEQLLAGSGIAAADLDCADTRITRIQELQVCANALQLCSELGLEQGRRMHVSAYGMVGYAHLSSATFGGAWRLMLQYPALLDELRFERAKTLLGQRGRVDDTLSIHQTMAKPVDEKSVIHPTGCTPAVVTTIKQLAAKAPPTKCHGGMQFMRAHTTGHRCPTLRIAPGDFWPLRSPLGRCQHSTAAH